MKSVESRPISRWLTMQCWSGWRISIGSSIVTMCCCRVLLMWSSIAASEVVFPEPAHAGRQAQVVEAGRPLGDDAEGERGRTPLAKAVDAEARQVAALVGDVEVAGLVKMLQPLRRRRADAVEDRVEIGLGQSRMLVHRQHRAVAAQHRRPVELEVNIAGAELDGALQQDVQVHG